LACWFYSSTNLGN